MQQLDCIKCCAISAEILSSKENLYIRYHARCGGVKYSTTPQTLLALLYSFVTTLSYHREDEFGLISRIKVMLAPVGFG